MPWVKLDDAFFANPKVIKAKPLARSLYLAGLCHCANGLTDGQVTKAAIPLLMAQTGATKAMAADLVAVGLWHDRGDHYEVHDWQEFNASAQAVSERRKAERDKKARQRAHGSRKATKGEGGRFVSPGDTAGDTPRESQGDADGGADAADSENEREKEAPSSKRNHTSTPPPTTGRRPLSRGNGDLSRRDSRGESPATRPDPTQLLTSSSNSQGVEPDVAGAGAPPEEDDPPRTPEARADAAIAHMARCDLRHAQDSGTVIRQLDAWLAKARANRHQAHHAHLVAAATERPGTDPVTLAEQLDPTCGPDDGGHARALAAAAETDQALANSAAVRAERARADAIIDQLDAAQRAELEQLVEQANPGAHRVVNLNAVRALALARHPDLAPEEA